MQFAKLRDEIIADEQAHLDSLLDVEAARVAAEFGPEMAEVESEFPTYFGGLT
jgi:hypothetical protein